MAKRKKVKSNVGSFQKKVSRDRSVSANKKRQKEVERRLKELKRAGASLRKKAAAKLRKK